jgi:hypothetical protein
MVLVLQGCHFVVAARRLLINRQFWKKSDNLLLWTIVLVVRAVVIDLVL